MNQTEKLILNEIRGFFLTNLHGFVRIRKILIREESFMHIQRIQVPDFRVLKNIDITFEKDFSPRIFPLGSQNGGGKSTLLQLIFTLLHCPTYSERLTFLKNILRGFKINENEKTRELAIVDIWDGEKTVKLEFFSTKIDVGEILPVNMTYKEFLGHYRLNEMNSTHFFNDEDVENYISTKISEEIQTYKENLIYINNYYSRSNDAILTLFCEITNLDKNQTTSFFENLSQKIFLAAPSDQVFLFLPQESKKLLFTKKADKDDNKQVNNYYSALKDAKSDLKGFFTYDFFATDIFIEMFQNARDKDFEEAVKTGVYGNHYNMLLNELNSLLTNKKVNVTPDLSGVVFTEERDGKTIELEPEDLSHGELKRLSIYMWLKHRKIEDSIVLMDEIENGFHLDWQYRIISDLKEWAPNNQYILATHSYDLCQSLTPKHVKELEPKLLKSVSN